jgi:hypothetical protein
MNQEIYVNLAEALSHRGLGKSGIDEAFAILKRSEELGLVHLSLNRKDIPWICNCCTCHCDNLTNHLIGPKPALSVHSSFRSKIDRSSASCAKPVLTGAQAMPEALRMIVSLKSIWIGASGAGCARAAALKMRSSWKIDLMKSSRLWMKQLLFLSGLRLLNSKETQQCEQYG